MGKAGRTLRFVAGTFCGSPAQHRVKAAKPWEQQQNNKKRTHQQKICKTQLQHLGWKSSELQVEGKLQSCKFQFAASLFAKALDLTGAEAPTVPCTEQLQQRKLQKPGIGVISKLAHEVLFFHFEKGRPKLLPHTWCRPINARIWAALSLIPYCCHVSVTAQYGTVLSCAKTGALLFRSWAR